jgi:hypothetical protein
MPRKTSIDLVEMAGKAGRSPISPESSGSGDDCLFFLSIFWLGGKTDKLQLSHPVKEMWYLCSQNAGFVKQNTFQDR